MIWSNVCGYNEKEKEERKKKGGKKREGSSVFVRKKMSVYPQREPCPLSDLSVCHFIVGASCSVIYPIAS